MKDAMHIDLILPHIKINGRKRFFEFFSKEVAKAVRCSPVLLYKQLLENEKQDSSAVGGGIAIPHMKVQGLSTRHVTLATLHKPMVFETPDDKPVDVICLLLSPDSDGVLHLHSLSRLSRMLKNEELVQKIRDCEDEDAVRALLINPEGWLLAA